MMIELEEFRIEFVASKEGDFIKFFHCDCQYSPIFWLNFKNVDIRENNEFTVSLKEGFFTYEFSFYKFYGNMRKMEFRQKLFNLISMCTHEAIVKKEETNELQRRIRAYC